MGAAASINVRDIPSLMRELHEATAPLQVSGSSEQLATQSYEVEQPWEVLSYGFRVDKGKASMLERTLPIFEIKSSDVRVSPAGYCDGTYQYSESEHTASQQFAAKMGVEGSCGAFSAAASMSTTSDKSSAYKSHRIDVTIKSVKYSIQAAAGLRLMPHTKLNPDVKAFIIDSPVEDLVELGAFYAVHGELGGFFRKTYTLDATEGDSEKSVTAELQGSYGAGMTGSCSAGVEFTTRSTNKNAAMKIEWHAEGGDPNVWLDANPNNIEDVKSKWAATVQDSNLGPFNMKLKPMWELVAKIDKEKGKQLEDHWLALWKQPMSAAAPTRLVPTPEQPRKCEYCGKPRDEGNHEMKGFEPWNESSDYDLHFLDGLNGTRIAYKSKVTTFPCKLDDAGKLFYNELQGSTHKSRGNFMRPHGNYSEINWLTVDRSASGCQYQLKPAQVMCLRC